MNNRICRNCLKTEAVNNLPSSAVDGRLGVGMKSSAEDISQMRSSIESRAAPARLLWRGNRRENCEMKNKKKVRLRLGQPRRTCRSAEADSYVRRGGS